MAGTSSKAQTDSLDLLKKKYLNLYSEEPEIYIDSHGAVTYRTRHTAEFSITVSLAGYNDRKNLPRNERIDYVLHDNFNPNIQRITKPLGELVHSCRIAFVRGITGIGKTVLAKRLVIGWANGGILNEFTQCYFLEGKQLNRFKEVEDLKVYLDEDYCPCETVGGGGVLFIIDAMDEIVDLDSKSSIIHKLLDESNSFFKDSKFIITGRPYFERCFKEGYCRPNSYELNHLSEDDIERYITLYSNEVKTIADTIYAAKNSSPAVASLLGVPRFLNAFCSIAVLTSGRAILNITEFYCWLLFLFLKQNGKQGLDDSEVFAYYSKVLKILAKISHDLIREDKVATNEDEFKSELEEVKMENRPIFDAFFMELNEAKEKRYQSRQKHLQSFLAAIFCFSTQMKIKNLIKAEFYEIVAFVCGFNGWYLESDGNDNDDDVCKLLIEGIQGDKDQKAKDNLGFSMLEVFDSLLDLVKKGDYASFELCVETSLLCVNEYLKHMEKYKNQIMFNDVVSKLISVIISTGLSNLYNSWMTQVNLLRLLQIGEINQKLDLFNGMKLLIIPLRCFQLSNFFKNFNKVDVHIYSEATASEMQMFIDNFPYCDSVDIRCKGFDYSQAAAKIINSKEVKLKQISLWLPAASNDDDMTETWKKAIGLIVLVESVELHSWKIGKSEWDTLADVVRSVKKKGDMRIAHLQLDHCSCDEYMTTMFEHAKRDALSGVIYADILDVHQLVEWYHVTRKEEATVDDNTSSDDLKRLIEEFPNYKVVGIYNARFDYGQAAARLREAKTWKLEHVIATSPPTFMEKEEYAMKRWSQAIQLFLLVQTVDLYRWKIGEQEWKHFVEAFNSAKETELRTLNMRRCSVDETLLSVFKHAERDGLICKFEVIYAHILDVHRLVEWSAEGKGFGYSPLSRAKLVESKEKEKGKVEKDIEGVSKQSTPDDSTPLKGGKVEEGIEGKVIRPSPDEHTPFKDADEVKQISGFRPWSMKKTVGHDGGVINCSVTGVCLEVPRNALDDFMDIEVSRLEPSQAPPIRCTLGESIVSDIYKMEPPGIAFKTPASLTIPHSIGNLPELCHLSVKQFDEEINEWIAVPFSPEGDLKIALDVPAIAQISKTSLYVLCCCLDVETWTVPKSGTVITPFNRKYGVVIKIEEDTFKTVLNVKVMMNIYAESTIAEFNLMGLRPSIFLHIETSNGEQPQKEVTISLPLQGKIINSNFLYIVEGDGREFKNATRRYNYKMEMFKVMLKIEHFTIFGVLQAISDSFVSALKWTMGLTGPTYKVIFSSFGKTEDSTYKVGCCQKWRENEMIGHMKEYSYKPLDFGEARLNSGVVTSVKLRGKYKIAESEPELAFDHKDLNYTDGFIIQPAENDKARTVIVVCRQANEEQLVKIYFSDPQREQRTFSPSGNSTGASAALQELSVASSSKSGEENRSNPPTINIYGGNTVFGEQGKIISQQEQKILDIDICPDRSRRAIEEAPQIEEIGERERDNGNDDGD